jgi:hypothetical protein
MARAKTPSRDWLAPHVAELLDVFLAVAKELDLPYAIGGALAMGAHGYRRHTDDIDAYVEHKYRGRWIRTLREHGLTVAPLFGGVHYVAQFPDENDPEIRIDLLVPADDPDLSAIEVPDASQIAGRPVEIWPLELLVVSKFQSTREKDHEDVDAMSERGLFDPKAVHRILLHMDEPALARKFWREYGSHR